MTREEGPERTQRTVAELLAKYGASSDESAPRRRRRRADDAEETAPQAIIDRVLSDSGNIPRIRDDEPPGGQPTQAQPPVRQGPPPTPQPPSRHRPAPQPSQQMPAPPPPPQVSQPTQRQMPPVAPPERRQQSSTPLPRPKPQPSQQMPQPSQQMPQPSGQWPTPPAEPGGLAARLDGRQDASPHMPVEGVTEQLPRIPDEPPGMRSGQHPAPHRVARSARSVQQPSMPSMPLPSPAYPQHEPDEPDNYPTEYHGFEPVGPSAEETQFVQELDDEYDSDPGRGGLKPLSVEHDRPVGDDEDEYDDEERDSERGSPVKEWLSMAGQLAIGVIGGAALWLGFNWLWGQLPAAALVVALVVIVGLVWVVRKIRRADDLQTTILTVLVGLVVTVSPAAMLLLNR